LVLKVPTGQRLRVAEVLFSTQKEPAGQMVNWLNPLLEQ
jgi:hypothetical protein